MSFGCVPIAHDPVHRNACGSNAYTGTTARERPDALAPQDLHGMRHERPAEDRVGTTAVESGNEERSQQRRAIGSSASSPGHRPRATTRSPSGVDSTT
jgi:hypothetical protein